ncbi:MAG: F0F1 ATP synthase subunit A, partial [Gemmatimonadales bacterium]
MIGWLKGIGFAVLLLALGAGRALAQEAPMHQEAFQAVQGEHAASEREIDIMHHLANTHTIEYPCFNASYVCTKELRQFPPVRVGPLSLDFSPTKHLIYVILSSLIVATVFLLTARSISRARAQGRPPKGFAGAMEAMALYLRQEVVLPNVGHHGDGYVPYLLTTFFFILVCNLLGLIPYGSTATGNIAVTAALAFLAFLVIEISGMRTLGFKGYLGTIFFLPPGLPTILKPVILIILTPIELIGKLAKPFALA